MQKLDKLYEGKAKKLYATDDPDVLWVEYMNQATATIAWLAAAVCAGMASATWPSVTGTPRIARACRSNSLSRWLIIVTMPVSCGRGETSLNSRAPRAMANRLCATPVASTARGRRRSRAAARTTTATSRA